MLTEENITSTIRYILSNIEDYKQREIVNLTLLDRNRKNPAEVANMFGFSRAYIYSLRKAIIRKIRRIELKRMENLEEPSPIWIIQEKVIGALDMVGGVLTLSDLMKRLGISPIADKVLICNILKCCPWLVVSNLSKGYEALVVNSAMATGKRLKKRLDYYKD